MSQPEQCPKCSNPEDIIKVCKHCGYEYVEDNEIRFLDLMIVIIGLVLFIYIVIILMFWCCQSSYEHETLVNILQDQWAWVTQLRVW